MAQIDEQEKTATNPSERIVLSQQVSLPNNFNVGHPARFAGMAFQENQSRPLGLGQIP